MAQEQEKRFEEQVVLDDTSAMRVGNKCYPLIEVMADDPSVLPIVMSCLEKGTLSIAVPYKGKTVEIGKVKRSPLQLEKLLRFYPLKIVMETSEVVVKTTQELIEVEGFDWTD